jgi:diketogulonate reductase-like aldo/keto reductase
MTAEQSAVELSDIPLATNQIEYHPYLNQASLVTATQQAGVAVTAYCAMAVGRVFSEPVLQAIARRYGKSVSQIVLRWLVQQKDVVALSRTEREERIQENLNIFGFLPRRRRYDCNLSIGPARESYRRSARACAAVGSRTSSFCSLVTKRSFADNDVTLGMVGD